MKPGKGGKLLKTRSSGAASIDHAALGVGPPIDAANNARS